MTRDRADDYDEKKQLILQRAAALFARKGYEITTMLEVAKACNASKSHLYHYFPAKEDLLFAIVSNHTGMLSAELSDVLAQAGPASRRFERFVDKFVTIAADYRYEQLVLLNDLTFLPPAKLKTIRKTESDLVTMLSNLLTEINPEVMSATEVQAPYSLLLFGMIIWTFTWYKKAGALAPGELAIRISDLFLNGFRAGKKRTAAGSTAGPAAKAKAS